MKNQIAKAAATNEDWETMKNQGIDWTTFDVIANTKAGSKARIAALSDKRTWKNSQPAPITKEKYAEIKDKYAALRKRTTSSLRTQVRQESNLELGNMQYIDKVSLINILLENRYGRRTMIAFSDKVFSN